MEARQEESKAMSVDGLDDELEPVRERAGLWRALADLLVPPLCLSCHVPLAADDGLCAACWSGIAFIETPVCPVSGLPFAYDPGEGILSAAALAEPPPYTRARAVMAYDDASRKLVSRFKYGDRMESAPVFARWMARAGAELLVEADLIVPVPLHLSRLRQRRFNQAAEIARRLAELSDVPCALRVLERAKATRAQVGLSREGRRRNVAGAFRVAEAREGEIAGRHVVLIDDVITTGATANGCTRALLKAGAASVSVLALARVVPGDGSLI